METNTEIDAQQLVEAAPVQYQVPAPVQAGAMTAMDMVALVVNRGGSIDELQKMMDFAERVEAREAKQAYIAAMTEFKRNVPTIEKNRTAQVSSKRSDAAAPKYTYKYANAADVCAAVIGDLAKVGITHSWKPKQDNGQLAITCILTHERGHSESAMLFAGMDDSGGKNDLQGLGSTASYLERYTLLAVCGLAADDGQDDDGAGISKEDRAEMNRAAADMRRNASPAATAARKAPAAKVINAGLLKRATDAASEGWPAFKAFCEGLVPADKEALRDRFEALKETAAEVTRKARQADDSAEGGK